MQLPAGISEVLGLGVWGLQGFRAVVRGYRILELRVVSGLGTSGICPEAYHTAVELSIS